MTPTTHIAMSSDISTAATCGWKYRLPKIFGVPTSGSFGGLVGWAVHDVLSKSGGAIHETWKKTTNGSHLKPLQLAIEPAKEEIFSGWREKFVEGAHTIDEFVALAETRLGAMLEGLAELMSDRGPPDRFLTEIQITNPESHHQGRIDALAEWDNEYETIDYKTYDDEAPRSHGYEHFQIVANGMLANYRNRHPESDFTHNQLVILYPGGRRYPRPTERVQEIVREARAYVLAALSSSSTETVQVLRVPKACWVCQRPDECNFYKGLERMHREGNLPSDEDELRRLLWQRRYRVLDFRQISHRWDFMVSEKPVEELERLRVAESGYHIGAVDKGTGCIILSRSQGTRTFLKGDPVQLVVLEPDRPILACMNFRGSIQAPVVNGLEVKITSHPLSEVTRLAANSPLIAMRTEVDLTKRELSSLDFIQRRASPIVKEIARIFLGVSG